MHPPFKDDETGQPSGHALVPGNSNAMFPRLKRVPKPQYIWSTASPACNGDSSNNLLKESSQAQLGVRSLAQENRDCVGYNSEKITILR